MSLHDHKFGFEASNLTNWADFVPHNFGATVTILNSDSMLNIMLDESRAYESLESCGWLRLSLRVGETRSLGLKYQFQWFDEPLEVFAQLSSWATVTCS